MSEEKFLNFADVRDLLIDAQDRRRAKRRPAVVNRREYQRHLTTQHHSLFRAVQRRWG